MNQYLMQTLLQLKDMTDSNIPSVQNIPSKFLHTLPTVARVFFVMYLQQAKLRVLNSPPHSSRKLRVEEAIRQRIKTCLMA